jgi:predicted negative regulator of RcsB-dependent stress response
LVNHLSEEEQIEAFKRWWAENGIKLAAAAVIVVGGFFGWQGWNDSQQEHADQGSAIYESMIEIVRSQGSEEPLSAQQQASVNIAADQLKDQYSGSGYAHFAALLKAKLAVNNDDLELAATELQWVLDDDPIATTETLVTLRLARVEAALGNVEQALQRIQDVDAGDMLSAYEEAKGDFYVALNDLDSANTAYEKALQSDQSGDNRVASVLRLKLGQTKPYIKAEIDAVEEQAQEAAE